MRDRMVRLGHPNLRIRPDALLPPIQERGDPRQVGLPRQRQQVVHDLRVRLKTLGHARRLVDRRQLPVALLLRDLDPPLDIADRVDILREPRAVPRPEHPLEVAQLPRDHVENAAIPANLPEPGLPVGAVADAEEPLEHGARVGFHRQRRLGVAPRDRGAIGAAIAVLALPHQVVRLEGELQRRQLRLLAEFLGRDLVQRNAGFEVGAAAGLLRMRARQEARLGARMIAVALARQRIRFLAAHAAQDDQAVPKRRERLQDLREREGRAVAGRRPARHAHAVGQIEGAEAAHRLRRRLLHRGERRHHAVEQRQRDGGSEAAQDGATGQMFLRANHETHIAQTPV